MKPAVTYLDFGTVDYGDCWGRQKELFGSLVGTKEEGGEDGKVMDGENSAGYLILCSHPHVYTLGRNGHAGNLLADEDTLRNIGAQFYRTDRGGDITYHGPGQLVGYPLLDLEKVGLGLRGYIDALEQSVIDTIAVFGVEGGRAEGKSGVWLEASGKRAQRKICAVGVRSSRFVTMHGFALNVSTDLRYYEYINPCGMAGGGVTSLDAENNLKNNMEVVKDVFRRCFEKNMNIKIKK